MPDDDHDVERPPDTDEPARSPSERGSGTADERSFPPDAAGSVPATDPVAADGEIAPGMPTADAAVASQLPEHADPLNPPQSSRTPLDDRHLEQFRSTFGWLRTALKRREPRFESYQRVLNQARMATTYDAYLATVIRRGAFAALGGAVLGVVLGTVLWAVAGGAALTPVLFAPVFALVAGAGAVGIGYYRSVWRARERTARIERQLPHGIAYLYALSHGGLDVVAAMQALADSEEEYGELAREFDVAVREMQYLGADPLGAIRSLRDRTASPLLTDFLDDLASSLDSGGDVTAMLAGQADDQFERAKREQSAFLEQVSLYAELYVGILVVGPIFAIIVLTMISITGSGALIPLGILIYLFVPVSTIIFLSVLRDLTAGFEATARTPDAKRPDPVPAGVEDDPRTEGYRAQRTESSLERIASAPVDWLLQRPERSLALTGPVALVFIGVVVLAGAVDPTIDGLVTAPLRTTLLLGVLPFLAVAVPLGALHEIRIARIEAIVDRFPDTLSQLASANEQGLTIVEGFDIVARRTGGPLGEELRRTANDMHWGLGTDEAFERLHRRVPTESVARTLALLSDASRYSSNLHRVIDVAARDADSARALELDRRSEMRTYVAIVVISFGLYLLMIIVLESFFLQQVADIPVLDESLPGAGRGQLIDAPDQGVFQAVLFHAALIQGVCAGLVAGELGEDSWRSGIKYSLALVLVTVLAFVYVTQVAGVGDVIDDTVVDNGAQLLGVTAQ